MLAHHPLHTKESNHGNPDSDVVVVSFPVAHASADAPRAYDCAVAAKKGSTTVKEKYVFSKGQFWADCKDVKPVECAFAKADLPADWRTSVTFIVTPRDSFGNCGRAISPV